MVICKLLKSTVCSMEFLTVFISPRNGRFISHAQLVRALREGYGLSYPLATFLAIGGHALLEQGGSISLRDLSRHNFIEHNASLGHADTCPGYEYAPIKCDQGAIHSLVQLSDGSKDGTGRYLTMEGFAKARLHKEALLSCPLDALHSEIARGECAMVLGIFGQGKQQVPERWINEWWMYERFPDDWEPLHEQGLFETARMSNQIKTLMAQLKRDAEAY